MREATLDYPGRIKSLREVENLPQFIEFILPYGFAKIYMTANRRWSFLEKDRRKKALAMLLNRVIRRFSFSVWDVRFAGGGFMEDFHTMPVIGVIEAIATEFAKQEGLISENANFALATFRLCGEGYITSDLKAQIDKLCELKMRRDRNLSPVGSQKGNVPRLYFEAVKAQYELEESLIHPAVSETAAVAKTA